MYHNSLYYVWMCAHKTAAWGTEKGVDETTRVEGQ